MPAIGERVGMRKGVIGSRLFNSKILSFRTSDGVAKEGKDVGFAGRPGESFGGGGVDDFQVAVTRICGAYFEAGQAVADEKPEGILLLIAVFEGPVDLFPAKIAMAIIPEPTLWMEGATFLGGGCGAEGFHTVFATEILGRKFRAPTIHKDKIPASVSPRIPIGHDKPTRNVLCVSFEKDGFNIVRELDGLDVRTGTQEGDGGRDGEGFGGSRGHGKPLVWFKFPSSRRRGGRQRETRGARAFGAVEKLKG